MKWYQLSKIPLSTTSFLATDDSRIHQAIHDLLQDNLLPRWSLSLSHIFTWPLYCRLPQAVPACKHCPRLVPNICKTLFILSTHFWCTSLQMQCTLNSFNVQKCIQSYSARAMDFKNCGTIMALLATSKWCFFLLLHTICELTLLS